MAKTVDAERRGGAGLILAPFVSMRYGMMSAARSESAPIPAPGAAGPSHASWNTPPGYDAAGGQLRAPSDELCAAHRASDDHRFRSIDAMNLVTCFARPTPTRVISPAGALKNDPPGQFSTTFNTTANRTTPAVCGEHLRSDFRRSHLPHADYDATYGSVTVRQTDWHTSKPATARVLGEYERTPGRFPCRRLRAKYDGAPAGQSRAVTPR
jgi:hypothetical protein